MKLNECNFDLMWKMFIFSVVVILCFCSYTTVTSYGGQSWGKNAVMQGATEWCLYAVMAMMRGGSDIQAAYADGYRLDFLNQDEKWVAQTDCVNEINRKAFCPGVKLKDLFAFWNRVIPSEYYLGGWSDVTNVFNPTNTYNQDKRAPRLGMLDIRESGGQYHACFLYYVEHRKESLSMISPRVTYYIEYIDPWWGSKVSKEGTFFEVYVAM